MSTGHKAALARGRAESATVRHYLEALETSKPKRGRKRTPASIDRRLGTIESQLAGADALTRLHLLQEQKDLLDERSRVDQVKDLSALEKQFIKVAKAYGERKGITYSTWRAAGVERGGAAEGRDLAGPRLSGARRGRRHQARRRLSCGGRDGGCGRRLEFWPVSGVRREVLLHRLGEPARDHLLALRALPRCSPRRDR